MDFGVAPSITTVLARLTRHKEYGYATRDDELAAAFIRQNPRTSAAHGRRGEIGLGDVAPVIELTKELIGAQLA